jgi:hypothetical protein
MLRDTDVVSLSHIRATAYSCATATIPNSSAFVSSIPFAARAQRSLRRSNRPECGVALNDNTALIAIVAPAAALAGVVITQLLNQASNRSARLDARRSSSRDDLLELQKIFANFVVFVASSHSVTKSAGGTLEDLLEEEWSAHSINALLLVEALPYRRAAKVLRTTVSTLNQFRRLHRAGFGNQPRPHQEIWNVSNYAVDVVSAVLRGERIPSDANRSFREQKRNLFWLDLEWQHRARLERGETPLQTGIVRMAWRKFHRKMQSLLVPVRRFWGFLFRA